MPPRPTPNFYTLLQVDRGATQEEIERAYDAARHAAQSDGAGAESIELIEQAFLTLSDAELRRAHDALLDDEASPVEAEALPDSTTLTASGAAAHEATSSGANPCVLVPSRPPGPAEQTPAPTIEAVFESDQPFYSPGSSAHAHPPQRRPAPQTSDERERASERTPARASTPPARAAAHVPSPSSAPQPTSRPPAGKPDSGAPRTSGPLSSPPQRLGDARDVSASGKFTGTQLRRVREARGLSLQELGEQTKVSLAHLENIEAERFSQLPPPVYLRGFLMLVAKALKLDPLRVAKDFLEQMAQASGKPE